MVVFHHHPCTDGFTAAWAVWLKHPDATFIPANYGMELPDESVYTDQDVYLVDFSMPIGQLLEMTEKAKSVTVLDHHKTAAEDLSGLPRPSSGEKLTAIFDMDKSGARITWEFLHPGQPIPAIVQYTEDRDLWRFRMSGTKPYMALLRNTDFTFEAWGQVAKAGAVRSISEGMAIMNADARRVREFAQNAVLEMNFMGTKYTAVTCVSIPYFASELCHHLLEEFPHAEFAAVSTEGPKEIYYSLRGRGDFDVSVVAREFGGGGHKSAAGFKLKRSCRY